MEMDTQKDLEGGNAFGDVELESRTTVTYIATTAHFTARVPDAGLEKIMELDDPQARRKRLFKKVRARPDAVTIPGGAKDAEGEMIVQRLQQVR